MGKGREGASHAEFPDAFRVCISEAGPSLCAAVGFSRTQRRRPGRNHPLSRTTNTRGVPRKNDDRRGTHTKQGLCSSSSSGLAMNRD